MLSITLSSWKALAYCTMPSPLFLSLRSFSCPVPSSSSPLLLSSCLCSCCSRSGSTSSVATFCFLVLVPVLRARELNRASFPCLVQPSHMVKLQVPQCQYLFWGLTVASSQELQCLLFLVPLVHWLKYFLCFYKQEVADFSSSSTWEAAL